MFLGTNHVVIDDKSRLALPTKWLTEFAQGLVLTAGVEPCLYIFPRARFESIAAEISELGIEDSNVRNWARHLSGQATDPPIDDAGRISIPESLREYAGLSGDVELVGLLGHIEIWNPQKYQEQESLSRPQMSSIAERVGEMMRATVRKD